MATCKVFSKSLGRAQQVTEVRLTTVADKKRSPEAKVITVARHKARRKLGCRWPFEDLVFETEVVSR